MRLKGLGGYAYDIHPIGATRARHVLITDPARAIIGFLQTGSAPVTTSSIPSTSRSAGTIRIRGWLANGNERLSSPASTAASAFLGVR